MLSNHRFRPYAAGDCAPLLELFHRAYGAGGAARSVAHWRWKFERNPGGPRSLLAVARDSETVLGFVGGTAHRAWHDGVARSVVQSVDHMVDPECRRGLARLGLFARLKRRWIEEFCGHDRCFVGFGFPSTCDFRIGARVARYAHIQPVLALVHRDLAALARRAPASPRAAKERRVPDDVDGLWATVRRELEVAIVRDAAHLRWRYDEHPDIDYSVVAARDEGGALRGIAVVRAGGLAEDIATIMDWVTPRGDVAARRALLAGCARVADGLGAGVLATWFPASSPEFEAFQDEGFRVRYTPMAMAGRVWDRRLAADGLRRAFFLTPGDIDFL